MSHALHVCVVPRVLAILLACIESGGICRARASLKGVSHAPRVCVEMRARVSLLARIESGPELLWKVSAGLERLIVLFVCVCRCVCVCV